MPFVSFSLFPYFHSLSLTFFFTFSVCVSFSVSSSRSLSWSLYTVSLSSFLTFLILLGSLSSSSDFFSFPLLLFLSSTISLLLFRSRCGLFCYPLAPYPHAYIALYNSHAKVTCNTHTHTQKQEVVNHPS